jgi:hypothetical protein
MAGATLMDDANEDDFWYQAPKGDNYGNVNNLPPSANGRTGSRKSNIVGRRI